MDIQCKLTVPKENDGGRYKYRSAEDILAKVKTLLEASGAALTLEDAVEMVGSRIYIKATASLYDADDGTLIKSVSAYAREEENNKGMSQAQITGAASSYARKYALNGLFAIDNTDDPDTPEYQNPEPVTKKEKKQAAKEPKAETLSSLAEILFENGIMPEAFAKAVCHKDDFNALTQAEINYAVRNTTYAIEKYYKSIGQ